MSKPRIQSERSLVAVAWPTVITPATATATATTLCDYRGIAVALAL